MRIFRATDTARGEDLLRVFQDVGLPLVLKDLSGNPDIAGKSRPNTFELWFGRAPLPASCGTA